SRYLHPVVLDYGERLLARHHARIESLVMACSGTEALEIALMTARTATGHRGIICTDATYHGNSAEVSRMNALPVGTERPGFRSVSTPQRFRPLLAEAADDELLAAHLDQLGATIAGLKASDEGFAGMVVCSILANEGLPDPPAGWFREASALVRSEGGLVIADEVQAGFARSGRWWGYETSGFEPDIVCLGKPMGNGLPVSAVAASYDLISRFREGHRYFNTFASSPVQAAAANAVLDEIVDRNLMASVASVGQYLREGLHRLQVEHPAMGDVRGHGLFIGVDWVSPGTTEPDPAGAGAVVEALKQRHMLVGVSGQFNNVVKIRPPLVLEREHADLFLAALAEAANDRAESR
ncbi:MAG: aminotransferase class III-fold pyridoxal phosphate-dependent enzyme, partial [Acidimicrobiia bacterium]|nr:aminotransferase class III-fold pyridoxal phosphate-dependent enzyme [Acidimicrobiia bacterium]